jgi:hypothetical protein
MNDDRNLFLAISALALVSIGRTMHWIGGYGALVPITIGAGVALGLLVLWLAMPLLRKRPWLTVMFGAAGIPVGWWVIPAVTRWIAYTL